MYCTAQTKILLLDYLANSRKEVEQMVDMSTEVSRNCGLETNEQKV